MPDPTVLDYKVEWSQPVVETLAFRTDVITSESGREQRSALREVPRQRLGFSVFVHKEEYSRFMLEMSQELSREFRINSPRVEYRDPITVQGALIHNNVRLTWWNRLRNRTIAGRSVSYNALIQTKTPNSLAPNLNVGDEGQLFFQLNGGADSFLIDYIYGGSGGNVGGGFGEAGGTGGWAHNGNFFFVAPEGLEPANGLSGQRVGSIYATAQSHVTRIPTIDGYLDPISYPSLTDSTAIVPIILTATAPHFDTLAISHDFFVNHPVFDLKHNWNSSPTITLEQPVNRVDYGNKFQQSSKVDFTNRIQTHSLLLTNKDYSVTEYINGSTVTRIRNDYQKLLQIFMDCKGRWKPFWYISPLTELTPLTNLSPTDTITIPGRTWYDYYLNDDRYEYLRLYRAKNEWITCRIIHARLDANNNTVLQLATFTDLSKGAWAQDSAWNIDWDKNWGGSPHLFTNGYNANQLRLTWMLLCRFETDVLTLNWVNKQVCTSQVAVRVLDLVEGLEQ